MYLMFPAPTAVETSLSKESYLFLCLTAAVRCWQSPAFFVNHMYVFSTLEIHSEAHPQIRFSLV